MTAKAAADVPEWVLVEAYAEYVRYYGAGQSLEDLKARGGFGPRELLDLLAGGDGTGATHKTLERTRGTAPATNRRAALVHAMSFARQVTDDAEWTERLALMILRAAAFLHAEGIRPVELKQATKELAK